MYTFSRILCWGDRERDRGERERERGRKIERERGGRGIE